MRADDTRNAPYYHVRSARSPDGIECADAAIAQSTSLINGDDLSTPVTATIEQLHEHTGFPLNVHDLERHSSRELQEDSSNGNQDANPITHTKRKETSSSSRNSTPTVAQATVPSDSKRRKLDVSLNHQLPGPMPAQGKSHGKATVEDARAAGVHSAAALFRRHVDKAPRKSTRPPMSKLFMSLRLTPENFLHLQSQAKAYMLDPSHPARQSCVGSRGKGDDTDMVKLRLFNCVREFLESGVGDRFFGRLAVAVGENDANDAARALGEEPSQDTPSERLVWPDDGNKIIGLVTPLMRRMVTNERQRVYAIEMRKGGVERRNRDSSAQSSGMHGSRERSGTPGVVGERAMTPRLERLGIFLVLKKQDAQGLRISGVKLLEKRVVAGTLPHVVTLLDFGWDELVKEIEGLLKELSLMEPALYRRLEKQQVGITTLRGVAAAAANALQNQADMCEDTNLAAQPMEDSMLARYTVKTLGEDGWQMLGNAVTWRDVLQQRAQDIWADGIVNVIVEVAAGERVESTG